MTKLRFRKVLNNLLKVVCPEGAVVLEKKVQNADESISPKP